ncbi:MAG: acyl carrier protein [Methylovulum sp.]|jgi:acyl carrier protein|nr:acyl carrier protein [Methylovulum sp.]TSA39751.1 MAG: acyl carrier protein [Methylococcaceae bacterium]
MLETVADNATQPEDVIVQMINTLKNMLVERINTELVQHEINENASILEGELGLDSIMLVEFISLLEDNFNLTFGENDLTMDVFTNLRTLADFLVKKNLATA